MLLGWLVEVRLRREKRNRPRGKKIRNKHCPFISEVTPHVGYNL
jgi:hypothetical protein